MPALAISGMGADSQSPLGTAFAFSRPNNLALSLSNTSLLLEYTSRVFINSLQETGDNNRIKRQEWQFYDKFHINFQKINYKIIVSL